MDAVPIKPKSRHVRQKTSESDSDFGSFVSVSALEDPLTALDFGLPSQEERSSLAANSTLTFFDKFTQDAKVASDHNKQTVLDELLKHEDEPLYWVEGGEELQKQPLHPTGDLLDLVEDALDSRTPVAQQFNTTEQPLIDLDHEFFTSKPSSAQTQSRTTSRPDQSPSRSSTLALPVIPAPPLADTHSVSFTSSPPPDAEDRFSNPRRSSSYSTLSNLSSRWMSSLRASSKPQHDSRPIPNYAHPTLKSISSTAQPDSQRSQSSERTTSSRPMYRTPSYPHSHSSVDAQISHGTPFGRPKVVSPFAVDIPQDIGHRVEKETASVVLTERKASTTNVLEAPLADMIRSHLPALARLPKKWALIYSLDQHGISLNTLYERCEAHMQVKAGSMSGPAGALVVIKDAGDGLFGAWMGKEGVHPSRGKGYYGSGERYG
ncbi:hypothetical protein H0H87_000649 [Tephrocybe sp. NHM501043]|nr:hypothetical protein H0H87_000649 [Tephrocybe sp. NHM501043]